MELGLDFGQHPLKAISDKITSFGCKWFVKNLGSTIMLQ